MPVKRFVWWAQQLDSLSGKRWCARTADRSRGAPKANPTTLLPAHVGSAWEAEPRDHTHQRDIWNIQ